MVNYTQSHAPVAQRIERRFPKPGVGGSNPSGGTHPPVILHGILLSEPAAVALPVILIAWSYPFTPLLLTLWTNHFWNSRNVISTGTVTIAAYAMMLPHLIGSWVWKKSMPTISGR